MNHEIKDFGVQEVKLLIGRLKSGKSHWYTPDFWVIDNDNRMVFVEVKGGMITQDGKNTFKDACEKVSWAGFKMVQRKGGKWITIMEG